METPPNDLMFRRSTRSALAEIPARLGAMTMTETPVRNNNNNADNQTALIIDVNHANLPSSFLSPAPSPDELIIQQRGRRRIPVTWSPDIDLRKREGAHKDTTPVKVNSLPVCSGSPNSKSTIVLRSTPRKRLLLSEPMDISSPEKRRLQNSPNPKKSRLERPPLVFDGPLDVALKGLSSDQLIKVIQTIVKTHPELEKEVKESLPAPDMRPLEDQLNYLKKNIFKSLPTSRLTSKTDSPAYNRAATHVAAFKKCIMEQARTLADSQQWPSVLEYVVMAWTYVRATPLWDNLPHNAARKSCFKTLAAHCMMALKQVQPHQLGPPADFLDDIHAKLQSYVVDSEDIKSCLKQLELLKKKA
ncbi:tethering factor for nuclear proteasome STS1 [Nilaparvata lugens]|uniref:tethering factor for nuclear proteasome STS1 n=1 Tax=Nilaparvata lugens TaxID=108931 RepID=UPI00193DEBB2|nr:tethering factor for nuclear proteasome STS1 [Nilaparvata lugens]